MRVESADQQRPDNFVSVRGQFDTEPHRSQKVDPGVQLMNINLFELVSADVWGEAHLIEPRGNRRHGEEEEYYQLVWFSRIDWVTPVKLLVLLKLDVQEFVVR